MKRLKNISAKMVVGMALVCTANSCSDFLELNPIDQRVESNFYRTQSDFEEALVAVYDVLQWNTVVGFHPTPMFTDIASDDAYAGGASRTDAPNIIEVDQFNIRTTNGEVSGLWRKHYIGIYRANVVIEKLAEVDLDPDFEARTIAQAKFLRAHFYFDLVRFFENVPLVTTQLVNPSEYNQPQSTPSAIFNQIALDLEDAIPHLPETSIRQAGGRVTKWSAKALLGRVYLFYNGMYNQDLQAGPITVDRTRAIGHLEDVINQSGADLLGDFAGLWHKENEFSVESIWEISYSNAIPWFDWGYIQGGEGNMQPQMQGPRVANAAVEDYEAGWSFATVTQGLYDAFAANDPRREATILVETELNGDFTAGFQHTGYFSKKYTTSKDYKPTSGQQEHNWGNNYRSIRFADVLLMAAELHARGGATGSAQPYLDRVRERVGLGSVTATLENILLERRLELALEGHRYWDLLRQGMTVASNALNISGDRGDLYRGDQVDFNVNFNAATRGFFPIPQSEIDLSNGMLQQNDGY
jgi:starch-binding outer membrane protein, SusD/RagB family